MFISCLTITFNEIIVPKANVYRDLIMDQVKGNQSGNLKIKESVSIPQYEDGILKRNIFANSLQGNTMQGVNVIEYDQNQFARMIYADIATWQPNGSWVFANGVMYNFNKKDRFSIITIQFAKELINLNYSPQDLVINKDKKDSKNMNYQELHRYIKKLKKSGQETVSYSIQLHQKIAIPFACLIFTLLGAPMGIKPTRGSSAVGIGLSLLIVVIYYIISAATQWLGSYNIINPWFAAWLPNITTGSLGLFLLFKKA
ncbi:MAG: YjgP/YjgQ permease [Candidatus Magnetoglobus multicellularis str. Araruama]|uniref:YjgP/YjgQ permease n=1 Tax=Candidatus Magnetoglobus multicellularis str. Araruama TaxID=890399 RepID=A0A1V1NRE0_9BACT|nr:MAG: YjgP/YjgQ permease [Candidatus Magnetoglobus multicellularis str. Araruama]